MKPKVALFLHQPKCSVQSVNGIIQALSPNYDFKIFTRHDLERDFFHDVACIAIPGGIGDSESWSYLMRDHKDRITDFVQEGGKYLGICMGAYWAGRHYFNMLKHVDAVQYMTRPGTDTRRPHAKNIAVTWDNTPMNMIWYDGCALVGDQTKFQTIARYANGDAMAIIQGNLGLIGCHPESEKYWYDSYTWMRKHWHHREHHKLLLDFTNRLMQS